MAKRKRLSPFPGGTLPPDDVGMDVAPEIAAPRPAAAFAPLRAAPIASIAADGAAQAALDELSAEMANARAEGRMVLRIPLADIDAGYLARDRMAADPEEMAALITSLRARGQQAAIEIADLGAGARPRYGLISGWRRLTALRQLAAEGAGPAEALAILRRPDAAAGAYLAMVEENEIRAGLSFYERARVVVRATDQGVFPDDRTALAHLFAAAPKARRSKIGSFARLVRAFDGLGNGQQGLFFPTHLSEKAGLALVAAVDRDPTLVQRIVTDLAASPPSTPQDEMERVQILMNQSLSGGVGNRVAPATPALKRSLQPVAETELRLDYPADDIVRIRGAAIADPRFRAALAQWIAAGDWKNQGL